MTYHVIGCPECRWLWVTKPTDRQQTVQCPRCNQQHDTTHVRTLYETDDVAEAHDVRGAFLADRAGRLDDYKDVPAYENLDERWRQTAHVDDPTPPDPTPRHQPDHEPSSDSNPSPSPRSRVREGPQVDVDVAERDLLQASGVSRPDLSDTFKLISSPSQPVSARIYDDTSPKSSDWLPTVLDDLIPTAVRLVEEIAAEASPAGYDGRLQDFVDDVLLDVAGLDDDTPVPIREEARTYLWGVANLALEWNDDEPLPASPAIHEYVKDVLGPDRDTGIVRTVGTGRGPMNAPIEAVQHGPAALHALAEAPPVLVFKLDAEDWTDTHNETIEHALKAFDALASGLDVRLACSPAVAQTIKQAARRVANRDGETPTWAARLTEPSNSSPHGGSSGRSEATLPLADAYDALTEDAYQQGNATSSC